MPLRFVNGPTFYCSLVSCSNLNTHNALCASGSCAVFAGQWNIPEPCVQRTGSHSHYFVPHALPLHCTYPSGRHHISQWPFKVVSEFSFSIEVELCVSTCQSLQDFAILWFCKFKDFGAYIQGEEIANGQIETYHFTKFNFIIKGMS